MYIVCFCSEWCQTCRAFKTKFEKIEWFGVEKMWVDIDKEDDLLEEVNISSIPSVLIISDDFKTSFFSKLPGNVDRLKFLVDHVSKGTFPKGHVGDDSAKIASKIRSMCNV